MGREIKNESPAANFRVISQDLKEKTLPDFGGKIKVIHAFPSLDTPVCDLQVKEFNQRAIKLSSEILVLGISKDLPFAQKRFCQENSIKNEIVLSDYKSSSFGINYGLLLKELNLLARAVVVVDKNDILRYIEIVEELTHPPGFDSAIMALQEVVKNPELKLREWSPSHCKPCEGGVFALSKERTEELLAVHRGWQLMENKKIVKEFKFKDFIEAKYFLDLIAVIAEEQGHHPTITIIYNKVRITLTTHAAGGLTDNDFIMAKIIDELGG